MSCSTCTSACGLKVNYFSTDIDNPLYYTQTIGGITKFYQAILTSTEYCEWPDCERISNWSNYTSEQLAIVSNTIDNQGDYILTVTVKSKMEGMHGYTGPEGNFGSDFYCSDGLSLKQEATIFNNGTTIATLNSFNQNCCACSYSAIYNADNPFEQIPWIQNSDGCGPGFIVCSPNQSYVTIAPPINTLCLPPDCPSSSSFGVYPPVTINMIKEITPKDFLADQQTVIDIKKTFSINWSTSLTELQRTIPNPNSGGRFIRLKPYLDGNTLDKKPLTVRVKTEDCELLETLQTTVGGFLNGFLNQEIQINLAKYAVTPEGNPQSSWGPHQINKKIIFEFFIP